MQVAAYKVRGCLLAHLAEIVVTNRADSLLVDEHERHAIARTVLRVCGAANQEITIAAAVTWAELVIEPAA